MRMYLNAALFALLASTLLVGVARADGDAVYLDVAGTLEVAPDGSVHDYTLETELDPDVAALVDSTLRGWKFEPVLVEGKPVTATTRMLLELEAVPHDDGYGLRVSDLVLGTPDPVDLPPPAYPREALRNDIGAQVSMVLDVDADGSVRDVHVEQVSLSGGPGKRADFYRERFADAVRKTALQWSYAMGEHVDGGPVAGRFRVPVTFEPGGSGDWVERQEYVPGPYHPSPWADANRSTPGAESLDNGVAQPLAPQVKLSEDVIGTEL